MAASASAVFAQRRETWSAPEAAFPQGLAAAQLLDRAAPIEHLAWTHRYDMRFVSGAPPAVFDAIERPDSVSQVWLRDEPPRPLDFIALASLCDSFFPRVFVRRGKRVPIGTVSLTTYFHADSEMLKAQHARHVLGVARALNFRNGFFDQSAEVWSDDRQLLASSHQIVYYRE